MWYIHATKVPAGVTAVYNLAVGQDVGEGALVAKFAVSLKLQLASTGQVPAECLTFVKYLQGARSVSGSSECRNGHAFPAWHAPWR